MTTPDATEPQAEAVRDERSKRKAALIRAAIYIAGTHFFAFFVMLLFFLGSHRH
ncbi:DUF6126 family protein [Kitasatospora azatica]|uniref:DUF6126 family protein n=1 Tax=Kitasatospora azatica TaxID=58347 RepID=UPI000AAC87BD|nr:DUF6126 family protein [Kitasatospora azatica]